FLPLKVIKDRLDEAPVGAPPDPTASPAADSIDTSEPLTFSPSGGAQARPTTAVADRATAGSHADPAATVRASMPAGELTEPERPQPIWMADLARNSRGGAPDAPRPPKVKLDDPVTEVNM